MKRVVFLLILLFLTGAVSLAALDNFMMEVGTGVQWIHNEAYLSVPGDKDPDPILFRLDLNFPLYFSKSFYFSPGLGISGKSWSYVEEKKWAMPVDPMWEDLYVLNLDVDLPIGYQFNFKSFSLAIYLGPNINLKIPLWGENQDARGNMTDYFYTDGKFLNVLSGLSFVYPLTEKFAITFRAETQIPLHNLWSNSGLPFSDGLSVSALLGSRFIW